MVLQGCFDDQIRVENHAVNGRSSKSFIDEADGSKCSIASSRATMCSSSLDITMRNRSLLATPTW